MPGLGSHSRLSFDKGPKTRNCQHRSLNRRVRAEIEALVSLTCAIEFHSHWVKDSSLAVLQIIMKGKSWKQVAKLTRYFGSLIQTAALHKYLIDELIFDDSEGLREPPSNAAMHASKTLSRV